MWLVKSLMLVLLLVLPGKVEGQTRGETFPLFHDDLDRDSLRRAIHRSLEFLQRVPGDRVIGEWPRKQTAQEIKESLVAVLEHLDLLEQPERLRELFHARFEVHESGGDDGNGNVLFTGYYQPVIHGSLTETAEFRFPIYGRPADLIEAELVTLTPEPQVQKVIGRLSEDRFVPYFSRHEIDDLGSLQGKGYEIAWVRDPVELYFLHIQGSGLLRLDDGRMLHVNYAASNGRPYTSIGKILIESGKIPRPEMSMQSLRRYLSERPEEHSALFARNESYVFFRFVREGPLGSLEVALTPERSIATDARIFPKGALAFIIAQKPVFDAAANLIGWQPFSRFVLNQDTGSAIRGTGRVDLYFGTGDKAGMAAGVMKSPGKLYFLIPRRDSASESRLQNPP